MSAPKSSSSGSLSGEDGDCGIVIAAASCEEASEFVIHQEVHEWDFLKSIVYGGLVESITKFRGSVFCSRCRSHHIEHFGFETGKFDRWTFNLLSQCE
ncbi:hypothetical protein Patl1_27128 [Pistacia atlantica]|uniref:Uncharacterized protein n=1 Tax=Pistacia atlantica TaxID=434234 RepID=A0ACC1B0M9_9ROSI|nr:hypothetical protein Patl1_27128 [Pistacia atlantica]